MSSAAGALTRVRPRLASRDRWTAARGAEPGEVVLIEPDASEAERIGHAVRRLGVLVTGFTNPWQALVHVGRAPAVLVIASARLGAGSLSAVVEAIKDETNLPVLIACEANDTRTIGPAILAGGRPLLALPYDAKEVTRVVHETSLSAPRPATWGVGRLSVVPEWHDAHLDRTGLDLSRLEFAVLAQLVRRGGRAASRDELVAVAWADPPADPTGVLAAVIKRIRHKFEALGVSSAVETVRGVGYRLNASALEQSERTVPQL